jgi:hypothetical protein
MNIAMRGLVASAAILLAACASSPSAPPSFDASASAEAQAATFVAANRYASNMSDVKKIGITGCNVMFAQVSAAHAGTGGGLFSEAGNTRRAEAKVSVLYTLAGFSDADMQRMTDAVCDDAEARLRTAGYEVVPRAELLQHEAVQALHGAGRSSPFEFKGGSGDANVRYQVYAPTGYAIFDERYIGTASGLGQAFRAAAGNAAWQHETRAMSDLGIDAVNLNIIIDFAQMQSSGQGAAWGGLASRNNAEVSSEVLLAVTGELSVKPNAALNCWNRFGKHECEVRANKVPVFNSVAPVSGGGAFFDEIVETTTTGDRVAAGVTKGIAVLAALGGIGGVSSTDITRYDVRVTPARFETASRRNVDGLLDMMMVVAKARR